MTILPLVIAPDERLKIKSKAVDKVTDVERKLMDDMLETMYDSQGIGLAAVQVGVHKRILVMDLSESSKRYDEVSSESCKVDISKPIYMINPVIVQESKELNSYEEGCLSFPDQRATVIRPKEVKVKYLDYQGNEQEFLCDDLLSTCVQHEIDHLDGIVFVDHVSKLRRDFIMRKVSKLKKILLSG